LLLLKIDILNVWILDKIKMIGIYKITSPTRKIYVWQSCNIEKRFKAYKHIQTKTQIKLYRSFNKHGIDNHIFEIIEECVIEKLNDKERYWQDYYNVIGPNGLNCVLTKSNTKSGYISDEIKSKISNSNKGKIVSKETKLKMSIAGKNKIFTNIHKYNLKISLQNRILTNKHLSYLKGNNSRSKKVINIITNEIYISAKECSSKNNLNYGTFKTKLNTNNNIVNNTNFKYL
jgi:group I intron endonuclease